MVMSLFFFKAFFLRSSKKHGADKKVTASSSFSRRPQIFAPFARHNFPINLSKGIPLFHPPDPTTANIGGKYGRNFVQQSGGNTRLVFPELPKFHLGLFSSPARGIFRQMKVLQRILTREQRRRRTGEPRRNMERFHCKANNSSSEALTACLMSPLYTEPCLLDFTACYYALWQISVKVCERIGGAKKRTLGYIDQSV